MNKHKRDSMLLIDYSEGMSLKQLSEKYRISRQRFYQIFDLLDKDVKAEYQRDHFIKSLTKKFPGKYSSDEDLKGFLFDSRAINAHQMGENYDVCSGTIEKLRDHFEISAESRWSKEIVIYTLRYLYHTNISLRSTDLQAEHRALHMAAVRLFGSFEEALKEAGLFTTKSKPRKKHSKHTKKSVIKEIKDLHKKGIDLSAGVTSRNRGYLHIQARRFFGTESFRTKRSSWDLAITAAGIDYSTVSKRYKQAKKKSRKVGKKK